MIKLRRNIKEKDLSEIEEDEEWGNVDWDDDWEDSEELEDLEEEW